MWGYIGEVGTTLFIILFSFNKSILFLRLFMKNFYLENLYKEQEFIYIHIYTSALVLTAIKLLQPM